MIQKAWDLNKVTDRLLLRAIELKRPLSCTLELTYRCNFRCRMCYIRMTDAQAEPFGRMRTVEEWLDMARQLRDAGVLYLTLTGGECTQYPGFSHLYPALIQMGFRVSIMSNAGAYDAALRELFARFPPATAGITLYGGCNETYAAVTGDPRGFDKALSNIRFLRSLRVPVGLNFTVIRQNALDLPRVDAVCRELGLPYTLITDIAAHHYDRRFSEALDCRLTPAERACLACHPPEEAALALENARALEKELATFSLPAASKEGDASRQDACIGSSTGCAIFWNGDMQTCLSLNRYQAVKPFQIGFEAAWAHLKAEQEMTFRLPAACQACTLADSCRHNCAGRRFEGTGSPHEPDPYTCQYAYLLKLYSARRNGPDLPNTLPCFP